MQRPESFLPTIKCSTCAVEIQIDLLVEHVCSGGPQGKYRNILVSVLDTNQLSAAPRVVLGCTDSPEPLSLPSQSSSGNTSKPTRSGRLNLPMRIDSAVASKYPMFVVQEAFVTLCRPAISTTERRIDSVKQLHK